MTSNAVRRTAIRAPLRTDSRVDPERLSPQQHHLDCQEPRKDFEEMKFRRPIPDRHSEDLFVSVGVEGLERQSAFHLRNGRRPHSQNDVATATIPVVVHVESGGSEPCGLDRYLKP